MLTSCLPLFGFAIGCWRWGRPILRNKMILLGLAAYYALVVLAVVARLRGWMELCFLPPLLLVSGLAFGLKLAFTPISDRPHPPGHCKNCGYNLTGNVSGICPECGTPAMPPKGGVSS